MDNKTINMNDDEVEIDLLQLFPDVGFDLFDFFIQFV